MKNTIREYGLFEIDNTTLADEIYDLVYSNFKKLIVVRSYIKNDGLVVGHINTSNGTFFFSTALNDTGVGCFRRLSQGCWFLNGTYYVIDTDKLEDTEYGLINSLLEARANKL